MLDTLDLTDDVAVVIGGVGLLGRPVARALVEHGASVIVADIAADEGEQVADSLGHSASFLAVDVTDSAEVDAMVEHVVDEYGRIDILVNCSYPRNENYGQPYESVDPDDWRENVDLHLGSYYRTVHAVTEQMVNQDGGGSIINFASIYGVQAPDFGVYEGTSMTSPVEYSAIKGGIINLTRYLASYLGPEGIRVNALSPGGVYDKQQEPFVSQYEERTPLGRMATPEDVTGGVVYLASDASSYVTGHNLVIDGGWTIQ